MRKIRTELKNRLKGASRVAVLGIGSELKGDDIAGMLTAQLLLSSGRPVKSRKKTRIIFGSTAPENFTGEIKKFKPTHLLIIDAADIGKDPGTVDFIDVETITGESFSTHMLPPKIFIRYLELFIKCKVIIVGIQPETLKFGDPCSKKVEKASRLLADAIRKCL